MRRDPQAYLWDAQAAVDRILEFTSGRSLDDYLVDAMLRSAVERQFEIVGEALNQLAKTGPVSPSASLTLERSSPFATC
jgi:uncharacterized protein with HEPN domain